MIPVEVSIFILMFPPKNSHSANPVTSSIFKAILFAYISLISLYAPSFPYPQSKRKWILDTRNQN